jgi:hypothetical protein
VIGNYIGQQKSQLMNVNDEISYLAVCNNNWCNTQPHQPLFESDWAAARSALDEKQQRLGGGCTSDCEVTAVARYAE